MIAIFLPLGGTQGAALVIGPSFKIGRSSEADWQIQDQDLERFLCEVTTTGNSRGARGYGPGMFMAFGGEMDDMGFPPAPPPRG